MNTLSSSAALSGFLAAHPLAVVQFGSEACAPCAAIRQKLDAFAANHPGLGLLYVPIEHFPEISAQNSVFTVPTLLLFAEGREAFRASGCFSLEDFWGKICRLEHLMNI